MNNHAPLARSCLLLPLTAALFAAMPALAQQSAVKDAGTLETVIITATEVAARRTHFLKTTATEQYRHMKLIDAMLASSCIPTYFPPIELPAGEPVKRWLVDGGVGIFGNPALVTAWELCDPRNPDDTRRYNPAQTTVFSFGTGTVPAAIYQRTFGDASRWWALEWIERVIDIFMDTAIRQQSRDLVFAYPEIDLRRFQVALPEVIDPDRFDLAVTLGGGEVRLLELNAAYAALANGMLLGIDAGGTHTDVVIVDAGGVRAAAKVVTNHENLFESVNDGIAAMLREVDATRIDRVNLSTTLSTNAIVENTTEKVGMIVSAGPGIEPSHFTIGDHYHRVEGALDHRGTEILPLDEKRLEKAIAACRKAGIKTYAAVSKFSTRNPAHENTVREALIGSADFITLGHGISGNLNFPRRIATAYYNSAVWRPVSYTHLRAHETVLDLVCRLLLEKKKTTRRSINYTFNT